jgi:hypothetical protein
MTNECDELHSLKGIYLLPHEACTEPWASISTAGKPDEVSRYCGKTPVKYAVYNQLLTNDWLNDDGINAYAALMQSKKDITVRGTFFWKIITATETTAEKIRRNVKTVPSSFSYLSLKPLNAAVTRKERYLHHFAVHQLKAKNYTSSTLGSGPLAGYRTRTLGEENYSSQQPSILYGSSRNKRNS